MKARHHLWILRLRIFVIRVPLVLLLVLLLVLILLPLPLLLLLVSCSSTCTGIGRSRSGTGTQQFQLPRRLAALPSPAVVDRARAKGWIWRDQQGLQAEAAGADADESVAKRAKR